MKLTEEQMAWILQVEHFAGSEYGKKYALAFRHGVFASIEKFGGIQWNKYPETEPKLSEYVDIITDNKRRITDCEVDQGGFYHREDDRFYEHMHVTHWAYINLPNQ